MSHRFNSGGGFGTVINQISSSAGRFRRVTHDGHGGAATAFSSPVVSHPVSIAVENSIADNVNRNDLLHREVENIALPLSHLPPRFSRNAGGIELGLLPSQLFEVPLRAKIAKPGDNTADDRLEGGADDAAYDTHATAREPRSAGSGQPLASAPRSTHEVPPPRTQVSG